MKVSDFETFVGIYVLSLQEREPFFLRRPWLLCYLIICPKSPPNSDAIMGKMNAPPFLANIFLRLRQANFFRLRMRSVFLCGTKRFFSNLESGTAPRRVLKATSQRQLTNLQSAFSRITLRTLSLDFFNTDRKSLCSCNSSDMLLT